MADKLLKSLTFPDLDDKYIIGDKTLANSGAAADAKTTGDALATKANIDGSYANLSAGTADQLNTDVRANDKVPYIFRTTGGSVDVGDREYVKHITGGTVAWNQLARNGNFANTSAWSTYQSSGFSVANNIGSFQASSTSGQIIQTINVPAGHKVFASAEIKKDSAGNIRLWAVGNSITKAVTTAFSEVASIFIASNNASRNFAFEDISYTDSNKVYVKNAMHIDLTQMFGSTIADYIYSLEQSTAGAGVAFFRKLFDKPYYAYDSGTLKSVEGLVSHDTVGFNQWDEEWEWGYISDTTGENVGSSSSYLRSKNYIPILPNTAYYFYVGGRGGQEMFYDANKNFISMSPSRLDTTPVNAYYARFWCNYSDSAYIGDCCVNIAWDNTRNGEYEPYVKHSYPLDNSLTLRGIPKLDASNNLYYDGDTYEADGTVTRRYGIVDLGTLNWTAWGDCYYSDSLTDKAAGTLFICSKYPRGEVVGTSNDKVIGGNSANGTIYIRDTAYNDAASLKASLNGVMLVYQKTTIGVETADPYTTPQICDDFGTEEYVFSDSVFPVPVGSDTDYPINMRSKLEMAPNSPSGDGDYIVRQTNGMNSYVPLVIEDALPTMPGTAGTYKLTVTVASGSDPVLSWEAE